MDWGFTIFLLVCFLAVVLLIEGGFLLWHDTSGPEVRQLDRRLRALAAGGRGAGASTLLKARADDEAGPLGRLLLRLPRVAQLERLLQQAGVDMSTSRFLVTTSLLMAAVFLVLLALRQPLWLALMVAAASVLLPLAWLSWARNRRLHALEAQLPDAVDLIARALRAGHAFAPAL